MTTASKQSANPPEHRLRVLMGVPAPRASGGGPALHLPMLVEDLRRAGIDVRTFPYGRWAEGEGLGLKIWHQALDLARYPFQLHSVPHGIVHLNSAFDKRALLRDVPFAFVTRLLGRRLVVKWHGGYTELLEETRQPWRWLVARLLRLTDVLCVLSSEEAAAARRHPATRRCEVVRNALDLRRYERSVELRSRYSVPREAMLLLFISRLLPAKGLRETIEALARTTHAVPPHLLVVGDGPERDAAERLATESGMAERVHFVGAVTEEAALDYYCGCDVLVFPTYHPEGFPMAVFQSVAAGLGIVTTRIRAAADYLAEPSHCLFVAPRSPQAVATALDGLLADPALLSTMRSNNRKLSRRFERRVIAREFETIYRELMGLPAAAPATVEPEPAATPQAAPLDRR